ncbi:MAG: alpha/beta hydrolase family protein [Blastocatellia bacterium]
MKNHLSKLLVAIMAVILCGAGSVFAQAPTCNQALTPGCLYFPANQSTFQTTTSQTTYTDNAGLARTIEFAIRKPTGAPIPMPVVIWSHGGAEGKTNALNSMVEWSETTAKAGYLTISIAHTPRTDQERQQLCQSIGINDPATCNVFKHLNWDRPFDVRAVIDELERKNQQGEFRRQIDVNHIAVGGHSAGAGGTLSVAGALRNFTGTPVSLVDQRPVAFLAFSPQGPGSEGFFDTDFKQPNHSWQPIARPALIGTGDGDNGCKAIEEPGNCQGDNPSDRRSIFDRMPPGNKFRIYIHDADTFHTLFALSTDKCATLGVNQAKCDEIARWLRSAGLAFLDSYVRNNAFAHQWLQSNNLEIASQGIAEWSRK